MADKKCDIVISTAGKWREDQVNTEALRWNWSKQTFERWNGTEWQLLAPTFQKGELTESPPEGDSSFKIATTAWIADYVRATTLEGFAEAREEADSAFQDDINAAYEALAAEYVKNGGTL